MRGRKKIELALYQCGMSILFYEAMCHALLRYVMQLVTIEEERIRLFIRGLNFELQGLFVHMNFARNSFNEVTYYVKKVEGGRQDGQAKALAKEVKILGNSQGSYARNPHGQHLQISQFSTLCPPLQVIIRELGNRDFGGQQAFL